MSKLIICLDGLGKDLVTKEDMPFLYNFGKENHFGTLKTLFAFTGLEYCFFTGNTPDKSGIWLEFCKSKKSIFNSFLLRAFYSSGIKNYIAAFIQLISNRSYIAGVHNIPKNKLKQFDVSVKYGLWKLPYFTQKTFAFYKWPLFVKKKWKKIIPKYENDDERLTRLLEEKGLDIYYTQLMTADKALHKFGKSSPKTKESLRKLDGWLDKHLTKFLKENKDGEVFIWSDHGFCEINNYIDLWGQLPKNKEYEFFIAGTTASFWFENEEIKEEILKIIKKDSRIKVLNDKEAKRYKIPLEERNGELVLYLKKGDYFFPNFYQKDNKEKFIGMHGYPDDKELDGIFISNKKIPLMLKMEEAFNYL